MENALMILIFLLSSGGENAPNGATVNSKPIEITGAYHWRPPQTYNCGCLGEGTCLTGYWPNRCLGSELDLGLPGERLAVH